MDTTTLGRSGIETSVVGLGCGGPSRLGQSSGADREDSVAVVRRALELGVTFFDSSELYRTEDILAAGVRGHRDEVAISTKAYWGQDDRIRTPAELRGRLERSLDRLGTDHVDVYHLHAVTPDVYADVRDTLGPELASLRDEGKIRAVGITEMFGADPGHEMLSRATTEEPWDVVMVGFNLLNPSARDRVFPNARDRDVGTLVMFAVRRALSRPGRLLETVQELSDAGVLDADLDPDDPLGFLTSDGVAAGVTEAAYRFCRHEPGVDVVLTGTGNVDHLAENVRAITGPPLPRDVQDRLRDLFGAVDTATAN